MEPGWGHLHLSTLNIGPTTVSHLKQQLLYGNYKLPSALVVILHINSQSAMKMWTQLQRWEKSDGRAGSPPNSKLTTYGPGWLDFTHELKSAKHDEALYSLILPARLAHASDSRPAHMRAHMSSRQKVNKHCQDLAGAGLNSLIILCVYFLHVGTFREQLVQQRQYGQTNELQWWKSMGMLNIVFLRSKELRTMH